jgi:hypothetical protein
MRPLDVRIAQLAAFQSVTTNLINDTGSCASTADPIDQ